MAKYIHSSYSASVGVYIARTSAHVLAIRTTCRSITQPRTSILYAGNSPGRMFIDMRWWGSDLLRSFFWRLSTNYNTKKLMIIKNDSNTAEESIHVQGLEINQFYINDDYYLVMIIAWMIWEVSPNQSFFISTLFWLT